MGLEIRTSHAGRYRIYDEIAVGGMAAVHLGRLVGPGGFARIVAIKKLHPAYARNPQFVAMFIDEARTAARVRHPNVVPILDVLATDGDMLSVADHIAGRSLRSSRDLTDVRGELLLVMEYVPGVSLSGLLKLVEERGETMPPEIAAAIAFGMLQGLAAAHEATSETGAPLGLVHRDVSPQNIMVGSDGITRIVDFGIAFAANRVLTTNGDQLKGKLGYMAPERVQSGASTQRSDIYSAAIVLWEMLTGRRLFKAAAEAALLELVMMGDVDPPTKHVPSLPQGLDDVLLRALHYDPPNRFAGAREFARALEDVLTAASPFDVSAYVERVAVDQLTQRAARVAAIESEELEPPSRSRLSSVPSLPPPPSPSPTLPEGAISRRNVAATPVPSAAPLPPSRGRYALVAAAAAFLVGAVVAILFLRNDRPSDAAPTADVAAVIAPVASVAPVTLAAAVTTQAGDMNNAEAPIAEPKTEVGERAPVRANHAPRPDCRVPYVVDGSGKRIYKRACLK